MSEKRLTYDILFNNYYQIIEKDDDGYYRRLAPTGIIDLLNEQQATIDEQKEEIDYLKTVLLDILFLIRWLPMFLKG